MDQQAEESLRAAFSGAIGRNPEAISAALAGVPRGRSEEVIGLALYVIGSVVNEATGGGLTDATVRDIAEQLVSGESDWIHVGDVGTVTRFLTAAATGDITAVNQLDTGDLVGLSVVAGAHLLAHYRDEGQRWYQYLDEILDGFETATTD